MSSDFFLPTYLYIKRHKKTGLKYFGKTIRDPYIYLGSGKLWNEHLEEHGQEIETLWVKPFTDPKELVRYAVLFSKLNHIVESKDWANMCIECGNTKFPAVIRNRVWINNGNIHRRIYPNDPLPDGFTYGHLPCGPQTEEHRRRLSESSKGSLKGERHWITNGSNNFLVYKTKEIPEGYWLGRTLNLKTKNKMSHSHKGKKKKWITNGLKNKMIPKDAPIPNGYRRGKVLSESEKESYKHRVNVGRPKKNS